MEDKTNNFIQCKINNINLERPVENIKLNMSGGASCFKGRTQTLENIRLHFTSNENKMVVIHGAPGLGKTETARRFAINYSDYYNGNLIWIFGETQDNIKECFSKLAINLNLGSPDVSQIYGKFKTTRCLFIFDNVKNMASIGEYLPVRPLHSTVDILITSQFSEWDLSVDKVALEPLSLEDSLQIFEAKLGDEYRKNKIKIWKDLVKYLEGIPLSLQIVSSILKDDFSQVHFSKFNVEERINDLKVQFINVIIPKSEIDSYKKTAFASIRFALERLKKEDLCLALDVLRFMAYLDADCIRPTYLLLLPSLEESEKKLERALTELVKYSLIQVEHGSEIKIHRTIQLVLRNYDLNEQNGSMFKTALKTALSKTWWSNYKFVFKYVNEFKNKLLEFCNENKTLINEFLLKLAYYHCNVVLEELLPKIINEYCVTEKIINNMLKMAVLNYINMPTIQLLIERYGAKIEISESNAFHSTYCHLSIELFDYLLKHNDHQNIINSKDLFGNTILHQLVNFCNKYNFENTIKCMDHLISKWNADISIRGDNNNTILHTACQAHYPSIKLIRYLIKKHNCKYLVNTQDNNGRTPLQLYCSNSCVTTYQVSFEIVSYLFKDCEADITTTDSGGWNTLFYICLSGNSKIIDYVLNEIECREIINHQDMNGNVPFTMVIVNKSIKNEQEKMKLINLFLKNKIDFKIRNNENKTLAEIAKEKKLLKLSYELKKYEESSSLLDLETSAGIFAPRYTPHSTSFNELGTSGSVQYYISFFERMQ